MFSCSSDSCCSWFFAALNWLADFYVPDAQDYNDGDLLAQNLELPAQDAAQMVQYQNEPFMVAAKQHEQDAREAQAAGQLAAASASYRQAAQQVQELQDTLQGQGDAILSELARAYYQQAQEVATAAVVAAPVASAGGNAGSATAGNHQGGSNAVLGGLSRAELQHRCHRAEARAQSLEEQVAALRAELDRFRAAARTPTLRPAAAITPAQGRPHDMPPCMPLPKSFAFPPKTCCLHPFQIFFKKKQTGTLGIARQFGAAVPQVR